MCESNLNLNEQEGLKVENDFLKMKMMLEHGAKFDSSDDIPAEMENDFLKHVTELENQFQSAERIKVFDKIGRPKQFRSVKEIPEKDIEKEWLALYEFLREHGIELGVCSPNVQARELYRFATEELFNLETDNISSPGLITWFIYDEFHPDRFYENSRLAVDECITHVFSKETYFDHYFADSIRFNDHKDLTRAELKHLIQKFKNGYDQIVPVRIDAKDCKINGERCIVSGNYEVALIIRGRSSVKQGNWSVGFILSKESGHWYICNVQVWGVNI